MNITPVAIFTFTKLEPLKQTIQALAKNNHAKNTELFVFSDGPKNEYIKSKVDHVRDYIRTIEGFKKVNTSFATINKGLANSIIEGVSQVLEKYDSVIVLEDDLITSPNFLTFMNQALEFYRDYENIISISGYSPPVKVPVGYKNDNYFTLRASSWGWATWKDRWAKVDWQVKAYPHFQNNFKARRRFNYMGSDMTGMMKKQMNGKLDSWAIRWCFHQFQYELYTVFPIESKINNIGFDSNATHTKGRYVDQRFATYLDKGSKTEFNFKNDVSLEEPFIKSFRKPYNLRTRLYYKLLSYFTILES